MREDGKVSDEQTSTTRPFENLEGGDCSDLASESEAGVSLLSLSMCGALWERCELFEAEKRKRERNNDEDEPFLLSDGFVKKVEARRAPTFSPSSQKNKKLLTFSLLSNFVAFLTEKAERCRHHRPRDSC